MKIKKGINIKAGRLKSEVKKQETGDRRMGTAKRKVQYLLLAVIAFFSLTVGCDNGYDDIRFTGDEYQNILQYIQADSATYSSFLQLADSAQMIDVLSSYNNHLGGDGYTLFLPSNEAVDKFFESSSLFNSMDELLANEEYVKELVRYHVVNSMVLSYDFPNGAMPDNTLSNDFLSINFIGEGATAQFKINNVSTVVQANIELSNGVVHLIDQMLEPVAFTGYQWVQSNKENGYSFFAKLLEYSGLEDTLNAFEIDELGEKHYANYTILIEPDEVYLNNGYHSVEQFIDSLNPVNNNYNDPENEVYKFVAYHILEGSYFLDNLTSKTYNTFGEFPVAMNVDEELKINTGVEVFDSIVEDEDTTEINYLQLDIANSNLLTKSGAVHVLNRIMYPYLPGRQSVSFQFYNIDAIDERRDLPGSYRISEEDLNDMELTGIDYITYYKSQNSINSLENNDYVQFYGQFEVDYHVPKVLAGSYQVEFKAHRASTSNAKVIIYVDGVRVGNFLDLTTGNWNNDNLYGPAFEVGSVDFDKYEEHVITIKALIPGYCKIDKIEFVPQ